MPEDEQAIPTSLSAPSSVMGQPPGETLVVEAAWDERAQSLQLLAHDNMPVELRKLAGDLMDSLRQNAGVAERFDAFCVQAFSKPDWAVPASAFLSELFESNEDRLAELVRVPDLVIELGCGQASLACTVASKWATRSETHRLSRLAESIVAAQGTMKNPAAVEVMLALAATLAVTRLSRAEQLFNAAVPQASTEHAESLSDARLWLAVGKVLASAPQEVRDLWDTRMRRPKTAWKWDSENERRALRFLAEQLTPEMETEQLFRQVVPACWWELAMRRVEDERAWQRKWETVKGKQSSLKTDGLAEQEETPPLMPKPKPRTSSHTFGDQDIPAMRPHANSPARFVLGWSAGVLLMGSTFFLAPESVYRAIKDLRSLFSSAESKASESPYHSKAWRETQVASFAKGKEALEPLVRRVKASTWTDTQMLLSGNTPELPFDDPKYLQLLVWLHLDPPADPETLRQLPRLLVEKADISAMTIWEQLLYSESPNAEYIRATAREVYKQKASTWPTEELKRLQAICEAPDSSQAKL